MHIKHLLLPLAAVASTLGASAQAATVFSIKFDSAQEVAPAGATSSPSVGEGTAVIQIVDGQFQLRFDLLFDAVHDFRPVLGGDDLVDPLGLVDATIGDPNGQAGNDVTRLHIHNGGSGSNGPVVFGLINPLQDLDGDVQVRRRLNGETLVFGAWDVGEGAGFENFVDDLLALGAGEEAALYFNLHSADDPAGAIRGQLVAVNDLSEVPIPGALPLMAAGLIGFRAFNTRKSQR